MKGFGKDFSINKGQHLIITVVSAMLVISTIGFAGIRIIRNIGMANAALNPDEFYTLSYAASGCSGSSVSSSSGTVTKFKKGDNTQVALTAVPGSDCEFVRWNIENYPYSTIQITMNGDKTAIAYFQAKATPTPTPTYYTVGVHSNNASYGTVSSSAGSSVPVGTSTNLIATAKSGYRFTKWVCSNNLESSSNPWTRTVNGNIDCTAIFEAIPAPTNYTVGVHSNNASYGTVSSSAGSSVPVGTSTNLIATAKSGYRFTKWVCSNNLESSSNPWTRTVNGNIDCTAIFEAIPAPTLYNVVANSGGNGTASVSSSDSSGTQITASAGMNVSFNAHPSNGYIFDYWECNRSGGPFTSNPKSFVVTDNDITCTAYFNVKPESVKYFLLAKSEDENKGTVSPTGVTTVVVGTEIAISAFPKARYEFDYWECEYGGIKHERSLRITVNTNNVCTAYFKEKTITSFTLKVSTEGGGRVYIGDNTSQREMNVDDGTYVRIHAIRNFGYDFVRWICRNVNYFIQINESSTSLAVDRDITCTAEFKLSEASNPDDENNDTDDDDNYIVSVHSNNADGGNVAFSDSGNQRESFDHETETSIVATPNEGFEFVGWSDGSTDNPRTIEVDDDRSYVAIFEPIGGSTSDDSDDENDGEKKDDEKDDGEESDDEESDDGSIAVPDTGMNTNSDNNNISIGSIIMPVTLMALVGGYLVSRRKHVKFDK